MISSRARMAVPVRLRARDADVDDAAQDAVQPGEVVDAPLDVAGVDREPADLGSVEADQSVGVCDTPQGVQGLKAELQHPDDAPSPEIGGSGGKPDDNSAAINEVESHMEITFDLSKGSQEVATLHGFNYVRYGNPLKDGTLRYRCRQCKATLFLTSDKKFLHRRFAHNHERTRKRARQQARGLLSNQRTMSRPDSDTQSPPADGKAVRRSNRKIKYPKMDFDEITESIVASNDDYDAEYSGGAGGKAVRKSTGVISKEVNKTLKMVCDKITSMQRQIDELRESQDDLRAAMAVTSTFTNLHRVANPAMDTGDDGDICVTDFDPISGGEQRAPANPRNKGPRPFTELEPLELLAGVLASSRRYEDGRMIFYNLPQNRKMLVMERLNPVNDKGQKIVTAYHESCRAGAGWYRCRTCRKFSMRVCPDTDLLKHSMPEAEHEARCRGVPLVKVAARDVEKMWVAFCKTHRLTAQMGLRKMLSLDCTMLQRVAASYFLESVSEIKANLCKIHLISSKLYTTSKRDCGVYGSRFMGAAGAGLFYGHGADGSHLAPSQFDGSAINYDDGEDQDDDEGEGVEGGDFEGALPPSVYRSEGGGAVPPSVYRSEGGGAVPPSVYRSEGGGAVPPSVYRSEGGGALVKGEGQLRALVEAQQQQQPQQQQQEGEEEDDDDADIVV